MKYALKLAAAIDWLSQGVGRIAVWLVLLAALLGAGTASIRYALGISSNAALEGQWYLFAGIFLLCAASTHAAHGHVRIDIVYNRWSPRVRACIDIFGNALFLLPFCLLIVWQSWPQLMSSFLEHEMSPDAGGLLRWPVKLLIPAGFLLLALQGLAEIIKRVAWLKGDQRYAPEEADHAA